MSNSTTCICTKCFNTGYYSRTVVTTKTTGYIKLRYLPQQVRICKCKEKK